MTDRRKAELERHLKAAFQAAGQAHLQATAYSGRRPETILALINTARAELLNAELALAALRAKTP